MTETCALKTVKYKRLNKFLSIFNTALRRKHMYFILINEIVSNVYIETTAIPCQHSLACFAIRYT